MSSRQRIGCGVVGISVLIALTVLAGGRSRKLPEDCTPVLLIQTSSDPTANYWWLSESVVLLCRYGSSSASNSPVLTGSFSLYSRVTHAETPLPELTAALRKDRVQGYEVDVSADKRWVLRNKQKWPLPQIVDVETSPRRYDILTVPYKRGAEGGASFDTKIVIKARSFANRQAPVQTFQIDLPDPCGIEDTVVSRSGDKIAWLKDPDGNTLSVSEHI